jgi:hypothetical protein
VTGEIEPQVFAREFQRFVEGVNRLVPPESSPLRELLEKHFDRDPGELPVISEELSPAEHPNLQLALDEMAAGGLWEDCGLPLALRETPGFSLGSVAGGRLNGPGSITATAGPVEYVNLPVGLGKTLPCAQLALFLGSWLDDPIAVLMVARTDAQQPRLTVEVLAPDREICRVFLDVLRERREALNVYRGKTLAYVAAPHGAMRLDFIDVPRLERSQVVLPPRDLEAIEHHTLGITAQAANLVAAGRHLRRGLLLYGPPGTGKTMSVMYLCNRMPNRTTIMINGGPSIGQLGQAISLARNLAPSMVVIEDVDLIAQNRANPNQDTNPLLFQLLNEMDNVPEQSDVIFVLTTNRLDLLEPALAARPGRVDHAVEIDLPDVECRRRLFDLYLRGLDTGALEIDTLIEALEGISAAFVKELIRRAVVIAGVEGGGAGMPPLETRHLVRALEALGDASTSVLRTLLGATRESEEEAANSSAAAPTASGPPGVPNGAINRPR